MQTIEKAGLVVDSIGSWNVLLRPVAGLRLGTLPRPLNAALSAVIAAERVLPVKALPGSSLIMRVHRE